MSIKTSVWMRVAAPVLMCATMAAALPADAKTNRHRRMAKQTVYRPLTVAAPAPAYNPYGGPAPFITAPTAVAGTIVGLPFRALGTVFPASADPSVNPLVIIGAPLHLAGQFAQLPFYAIGQAFGANPPFPN